MKHKFSIGNIDISIPERYWYHLATSKIGVFPLRAMKYLDKKLDKLSTTIQEKPSE